MKKSILALAGALTLMLSMTGCLSALFTVNQVRVEDIPTETIPAHEDKTEDSAESLTVDSDFMQDEWIDKHGFVMRYEEGILYEYQNMEGQEMTFEDGTALIDGRKSKISITALDADTIQIGEGDEAITAVRIDSAQGKSYLNDIQKKLIGAWVEHYYGAEMRYQFGSTTLELYFDGYEMEDEGLSYVWDGACIILVMQGQLIDGINEDNSEIAIRIVDDTLTMYNAYSGQETTVLHRPGSAALAAQALKDLAGTWYNTGNLDEVWVLNEDGTAVINGENRTFTAAYGEDWLGVRLTLDDGTKYRAVADDPAEPEYRTLYLYDAEKGTAEEAVHIFYDERHYEMRSHRLETEKASLFEAYPDKYGWMQHCETGDIPLLADEEYIRRSVAQGIFYVSTPEELASFNYYVNTQLDGQYCQMELENDISLALYEWAPMGWSAGLDSRFPFTCTVNGNGHTISDMYICTEQSDTGFIGWETGCAVRSLHFEDATVIGGSNTGILAGQAIGGLYEDCSAHGGVSGGNAGSLLGYEASCTIRDCEADVVVNGEPFPFLSWNEKEKSRIVIDDPVTITIAPDHTVTRPEVEGYENLGWMVFYNGEEVLHRNAENEYSYQYFGDNPGKYEICLTAYVSGQYVPISNTVSYSIS